MRVALVVALLPACRTPSVGFPDDLLGDCGGAFRDPGRYPNQLAPGTGLARLTMKDPEAVCNDGTPAVLYVRGGSDDWVMHLQGGGTCTDFASCAERWCGTGYHDASKMSSRWAPDEIEAIGLTSTDDRNAFADATQVFFYYCSSDAWTGTSFADLVSDDGRELVIHRRGHAILEAALEQLRSPVGSDDGRQTLPDLDDARSLLFTGTSGGSAGAQENLDWVRSRMPDDVPVYGVFDAAFSPRPETLPDGPRQRIERETRAMIEGLNDASSFLPFADESCVEALGGTDDAWKCHDPASFVYDHVTTPFLARQDYRDPLILGNYTRAHVTEAEFAKAVRESLLSLAELPSRAAEGAAMSVAPSAYGPDCGQHVALESHAWFFDAAIEADGVPVSLHDAIVRAVDDGPVSIVDDVEGSRSVCVDLEQEH